MVSKLAGHGSDNSDSEENADGKNASGEKTGVYKPPMMSSSHYGNNQIYVIKRNLISDFPTVNYYIKINIFIFLYVKLSQIYYFVTKTCCDGALVFVKSFSSCKVLICDKLYYF